MFGLLAAGATGAALAYFLDPQHGRRRRHEARDRLESAWRKGAARVDRYGRYAEGVAEGARHDAGRREEWPAPPPNDAALADKVASIIFRDPSVDKGKINVNAEDGVVVLRGEAARPEQINTLVEQVRAIPGVRDVENLLHLPHTPARMS
jgi:hypothetical protein